MHAKQFDIMTMTLRAIAVVVKKYDFNVITKEEYVTLNNEGRMTNCISGCSNELVEHYKRDKEAIIKTIAEKPILNDYKMILHNLRINQ